MVQPSAEAGVSFPGGVINLQPVDHTHTHTDSLANTHTPRPPQAPPARSPLHLHSVGGLFDLQPVFTHHAPLLLCDYNFLKHLRDQICVGWFFKVAVLLVSVSRSWKKEKCNINIVQTPLVENSNSFLLKTRKSALMTSRKKQNNIKKIQTISQNLTSKSKLIIYYEITLLLNFHI